VQAWTLEFSPYESVRVAHGSIFEIEANALVSPANGFGFMDGGLDAKLRAYFGHAIEDKVRHRITTEFHGELPVGLATIVESGHAQYPYLVCAPTMRYPADVSRTINAYLAMKALLSVAVAYPLPLRLAVPGLCSSTGGMPPGQVARQMRIAYERAVLGMYACSHWREERAFERFVRGET
jgi:O-acetyl-ADP-ribose deacetylase (regulator of RNase III)